MPIYESTVNVGGMLPQSWGGELLLDVLREEAACMNAAVAQTVQIDGVSIHFPVLRTEEGASFLIESSEIDEVTPGFDEIVSIPKKCGAIQVISAELAADGSPSAAKTVGDSLGQSLAYAMDAAFFGDLTAPSPAGLGSLTTATASARAAFSNLDAFAKAQSNAGAKGALVTSFVAGTTRRTTLPY